MIASPMIRGMKARSKARVHPSCSVDTMGREASERNTSTTLLRLRSASWSVGVIRYVGTLIDTLLCLFGPLMACSMLWSLSPSLP